MAASWRQDTGKEIHRLLWDPTMPIEIHTVIDVCEGCVNLSVCLTEEEIALLSQIVAIPLQIEYGPFVFQDVAVLYLKLFGNWGI